MTGEAGFVLGCSENAKETEMYANCGSQNAIKKKHVYMTSMKVNVFWTRVSSSY